ncbi:MAG: TRAP transporter small permease [Alphaproteobacteria bacterium]|nr:TRAP transporter small permease [Alphaproteobacteria bacterium]
MAESTSNAARPTDPVGRALYSVVTAMAIFGGILCTVIAVMVTVSVTGRYLFSAPIPGDYDIVGIIAGCAIFAFLPYCQMIRGNVMVDFFTNGLAPRARIALDAFGSLLYLIIAILFTWRLHYGAFELYETNQQIAAFSFYRWWTLPLNILCMFVLIAVVAYTLVQDIKNLRSGRAPDRAAVTGD